MKYSPFSRWVALGACLVLFACASAQERGQEALTKGDYESAARNFEYALRSNPNNAEARAGLVEARRKILDEKLIQVRLARQGGNWNESIAQLLGVLNLEKAWAVSPSGAAISTQNDEMEEASKYALGSIGEAIKAELPLKAEQTFDRFSPLFQDPQALSFRKFQELHGRNKKIGRAQCVKFAQEGFQQKPYLADLVQRYCSYWGEKKSLAGFKPADMNATLYRGVKVTGKDISPNTAAKLSAAIDAQIRNQPWYSPQGALVLTVDVDGTTSQNKSEVPIQLVHQYKEQEKYVAYEDVTKERQVPYEVTTQVMDPQTGRMITRRSQAFRTEQYTEKQPVERTRDIDKTFPYGAWQVTQMLSFNFTGTSTVAGKELHWSTQDQSQAQDTRHDISMPNIGLSPKAPTAIPDSTKWMADHETQFASALAGQMGQLWSEMYCNGGGDLAFGPGGNRAYQCLRLATAQSQPPQSVEQWHQKYFGLGVQEVQRYLSKK